MKYQVQRQTKDGWLSIDKSYQTVFEANQACKACAQADKGKRFRVVSTDEKSGTMTIYFDALCKVEADKKPDKNADKRKAKPPPDSAEPADFGATP